VRAIFIGLLWAYPYVNALLYYAGPAYGTFLSGWAWLAVVFGFPVLVAFAVAVLTGPYDRLALITLLIPATADFVTSTHINWMHTGAGTYLGPMPMLDLAGLILLALIGIALKRRLVPARNVMLSARETRLLSRNFWLDIGALIAIAVVLLGIDAVKIVRDQDASVFAKTRKELLTSPTSTEADRLQVVMKLYSRNGTAAIDVLHEALKNPSAKVRLVAAARLLQQGDSSGLAELEEHLMQSSTFTITNENQVIHSDWLGYGQGGPVSLTFDLGRFLNAVTDPNAAPILTRLTSSADPDVRDGASAALENFRIRQTNFQPPHMR
jgi:hypothetical protein